MRDELLSWFLTTHDTSVDIRKGVVDKIPLLTTQLCNGLQLMTPSILTTNILSAKFRVLRVCSTSLCDYHSLAFRDNGIHTGTGPAGTDHVVRWIGQLAPT